MSSVIYMLQSAIYCCFYVSFKIGQFIVTSISAILGLFLTFTSKALLLFNVISEDFVIFVEDLVQRLNHGAKLVNHLADSSLQATLYTIEKISSIGQSAIAIVIATCTTLSNGLNATLTGIGTVFVFVKEVIVNFGNGIWFLTTFMPLSFLNLIIACMLFFSDLLHLFYRYFLKRSLVVKEFFVDCYSFATDVPLESIAGLVTTACVAYIFLQFYITLYVYFQQTISSFQAAVSNKYRGLKTKILRIFSRRPDPVLNLCNDSKSDDRYCIICQERMKCILLLPCRHLCMCHECNVRLRNYNRNCPICRKEVDQTLKVFV